MGQNKFNSFLSFCVQIELQINAPLFTTHPKVHDKMENVAFCKNAKNAVTRMTKVVYVMICPCPVLLGERILPLKHLCVCI